MSSPTSPDFSGWNWVAQIFPFATAAVSVGAQYSFSLGKKALTPEVAAQDAKASEQAAPEIPQEVPPRS